MSTPSEKAADRMCADLDAMKADCLRLRGDALTPGYQDWIDAWSHLDNARKAILKRMSERDRKLAG